MQNCFEEWLRCLICILWDSQMPPRKFDHTTGSPTLMKTSVSCGIVTDEYGAPFGPGSSFLIMEACGVTTACDGEISVYVLQLSNGINRSGAGPKHWEIGKVNPLRAKLFKGNKNIYLHFMSFLHIDLTQVLKILPQVRAGSTYSI